MKYIRTKDNVFDIEKYCLENAVKKCFHGIITGIDGEDIEIIKSGDTIEELCDCFIKIKRKRGCKDFILKHDFRDLPLLREQRIKYPDSPVYGAIHIEDKGLIYVAKMNEKGELELL